MRYLPVWQPFGQLKLLSLSATRLVDKVQAKNTQKASDTNDATLAAISLRFTHTITDLLPLCVSVDHVASVLAAITANCCNLRAVAAAANSVNCVRWRPIVSATKVASETRAFLRTLRNFNFNLFVLSSVLCVCA